MAIELRSFASGDTDYIAKLNANFATIKSAIDALQQQISVLSGGIPGGGDGGTVSPSEGAFFGALFNYRDSLIGHNSYKPTFSGTTAVIAPGAMYLVTPAKIVTYLANQTIGFGGQPAGTYYIVIDSFGHVMRSDTVDPGTAYEILWSGTAMVGDAIQHAPAFFDTLESAGSRKSTALSTRSEESPPISPSVVIYPTLDARLEAGEKIAKEAHRMGSRVRKVGATVTSTGLVGAIQVDFTGTIIGWSVIADASGSLTVEVSRAGSGDPPAIPTIPNPTTNKISASAPITLSSAQSATQDAAGVSTWDTDILPWDVIQFKVNTLTTLTTATLYLLIEEQFPELLLSPPDIPDSPPEPEFLMLDGWRG